MMFALFQNEGSKLGGALQSIWVSSTTRLPPLDAHGTLLCVLIALAAVLIGPAWRVTRNAITIAHEGGHALIAVLTGRKLESIRLHADTSGVTVRIRPRPRSRPDSDDLRRLYRPCALGIGLRGAGCERIRDCGAMAARSTAGLHACAYS
jgi:hypothetical protein